MAEKEQAPSEVQYYLNHIAAYDREFSKWMARVDKILKKYRDENRNSQDTGSRFNILWSNVQVLKAATFARLPKPDVSRRFRDNDPVGRVASLLLERALDYEINHYNDYRESLTSCVYDRFLGGRGIAWARYEPKFKPMEQEEVQITEDTEQEYEEGEQGEAPEVLDYECAPTDYVHWKDFGHNVARTWEETSIVWRRVYMNRDMLIERFGEEIGNKVPLDAQPEEMKNATKEGVDKRAAIYEIWDKDKGVALWLSKSMNKILDEKDDPLELEEFYPCPKPLYSTITNESLIPVPDYALYQDQAVALDNLSDKIDGLAKFLQVKGVYDSGSPELSRLFTEATNGDLIPVKNWNAFAEKQGLRGALDLVDLAPIASALAAAYQAFEQVKTQIYEITGISDIIRGQSMASETATAQQIKGQYASLRLKSYQDEVARFATYLIQLKAQIICKHFDPQTILMISAADQLNEQDKQYIPQALQLMKNEPMRSFRIEISTDSLIVMDESQEKQDRVEFLGAVSSYMEKAVQAAQISPQIVPLTLDLLKFGVTGYKVGKSIEGQIDQTADMLKQQMAKQEQAKSNQPPQPTDAQVKAQAQQQTEQMRQQEESQRFQLQQQMESQKHQAELQMNQQMAIFNARLERDAQDRQAQHELMLQQQELMMKQMQERWSQEFDARLKIMLAEISAKTTITAAQESGASQAVE